MSFDSLLGLFGVMVLLAVVPGPAVFAIISRSFSSGTLQCIAMTAGIVLGDYVFIILALLGLSALAEIMGTASIVVKYLSAAYLIWLGYQLLNIKAVPFEIEESKYSYLASNFLTGLLITLGNPKAILFYVGFFPAFINTNEVTFLDAGLIMLAATLAFGSVNTCYALLAVKAKRTFSSPKAANVFNKTAGTIMISTGAFILVKP